MQEYEQKFFEGCMNNDLQQVKECLEKGVSVNIKSQKVGENGNFGLIYAAKFNYPDLCDLLLSKEGIQVNNRNELGLTALMMSCKTGHYAITERLIAAPGIDLYAQDALGNNSAILASENKHNRCLVAFAKVENFDWNIKNRESKTVAYKAVVTYNVKLVKILLTIKSINWNIGRRKMAPPPLTSALLARFYDIAKLLLLYVPDLRIDLWCAKRHGVYDSLMKLCFEIHEQQKDMRKSKYFHSFHKMKRHKKPTYDLLMFSRYDC